MTTIVTRVGKGSPLTNTELDANFTNLNNAKYESGDSPTFNAATITSINGLTVGKGAGAVSTNTAVGASALAANTTGANNTAAGYLALTTNISGSNNSAFGLYALRLNTGSSNSAFGVQALDANTGSYNTAVGMQALTANTTASANTAVGYQASYGNINGTENVAVGYQASYTTTNAFYTTALGFKAAYSLQNAWHNTAVGHTAMYLTTSGEYNTAVGRQALYYNTTGSGNDAVGYQALYGQSGLSTGSYNAAFGRASLYSNTTGTYNTAVGQAALYSNTSGANNVAVGLQALLSNTTASNNTAVGYQAGYTNQTGIGNLFVGKGAGYTATGDYSTYVGFASGPSVSSTGTYNTAVGAYAGNSLTSGSYNTFIGGLNSTGSYGAGSAITSGSKNTIIGNYSGNNGGLDIRTSNNYIVLSDGDGNPRMYANGAAWTNPGSMSVGGMVTYTSYSQSFSLGTTRWIRLCQLGNPGTMRIKYFLGSSNSEEYGEVLINATYNASGNQITVNRQSYNSHLLEVRLVATGGSGYPYDVFFNIRSDQFAPSITWTPFDVRANGFSIYNDTTSPGAASSSLVLETGSGTSSNIVATNGLYGAYGGGVQFPATQVASSNANTLDDYEEGTWTPRLYKNGTEITSPTSAIGTYVKVGQVVYVSIYFYKSSGTSASGGIWTVENLPFSSLSFSYQSLTAGYAAVNSTYFSGGAIRWQVSNGTNAAAFYVDGGTPTTDWTTGFVEFSFTGCYRASA